MPWGKGQSGNPNGRPKRVDETELQAILDKAIPYRDRLQLFQVLASRARAGDSRAAALVLAYLYGKPIETANVNVRGDITLRLEPDLTQYENFFERQEEASRLAWSHKYTLYGGSRGPGKSHWLRWFTIEFLKRMYFRHGLEHVRAGLFCEDYPSLKDRHLTKLETFPSQIGELKDSKSEGLAYHLRPEFGGGVLALRNLDDPSKYKSSEFALVAVDELTQNRQSVFDTLRGSLRWPGIEEPKFIAASNPDGPGQVWVRTFWIERQLPPELQGQEDRFAFVKALPTDNPYLPLDYWQTLDSLPDQLRRAWRDGDWYVSMVGLVYQDFAAENIEAREPDPALPIELGCDDGYVDPRCILFIQKTPTEVLVFDEIFHSRHLAETCVSEVIDRCQKNNWPKPEIAVTGPESKELQQRFRQADIAYRSKPHKIVEGIAVVRRLVKDTNGVRVLRVHPRCKNLIRELTEGYRYPEAGTRSSDEVPLDENNHAADALRYHCFLRTR